MGTQKLLPPLGIHLGNLFGIGRNYADHAKEMKTEPPKEPMVFLKPNSALCFSGQKVVLPRMSKNVHHEVEIVVAIARSGKNIPLEQAENYIAGIAVGLDITARDLQEEAKKKGTPWTLSKGFDTFAPVSSFVPPESLKGLDLEIELKVNGDLKQHGKASQMIFSIPFLVHYLSSCFTLSEGDLIFTGTPAGVGRIHPGDKLVATLCRDRAQLELTVTEEKAV